MNNEQHADETIASSSTNSEQQCLQDATSLKTAILQEAYLPPRRSQRDRRNKQEKKLAKDEKYKKELEDKDESGLELVDITAKGKGVLVN